MLAALALVLGSLIHGLPVSAHGVGCAAAAADCLHGEGDGAASGHRADHRGDRSADGCDPSSCNPAAIIAVPNMVPRTEVDESPATTCHLPAKRPDEPPVEPPRPA